LVRSAARLVPVCPVICVPKWPQDGPGRLGGGRGWPRRVRLVYGSREPVVLELDDECACVSCSLPEICYYGQESGRRWDCLVPRDEGCLHVDNNQCLDVA
jgi:hypothetical protein